MTSEAEKMLDILMKLKERWNNVLDDLINEFKKVVFYEAKAEGNEFKAKVVKVLSELYKMYNEDPKKLYSFVELWKRVQGAVKDISKEEYYRIHVALMRLKALDKLNTSEGNPLYVILPKIVEIKPEDIIEGERTKEETKKEEEKRVEVREEKDKAFGTTVKKYVYKSRSDKKRSSRNK
jgi:hypothetical protein